MRRKESASASFPITPFDDRSFLVSTRRGFLRTVGLAGAAVVSAGVGGVSGRMIENANHIATERYLTPKQTQTLIHLAAQHPPTEWGIYPSLEFFEDQASKEVLQELDLQIGEFREHLGTDLRSIGWFGRLESAQDTDSYEWQMIKAELESKAGHLVENDLELFISLGLGGGGRAAHPFTSFTDEEISLFTERWAKLLASLKCRKRVRVLFEVNIQRGDIAYAHRGISSQLHQERFHKLFELVAIILKNYMPDLEIHVSLAAHGAAYEKYVPSIAKEHIGFDLYDDIDGLLYAMLIGVKYSDKLFQRVMYWIQTLLEQEGQTSFYLHELGSRSKDTRWLEKVVLTFLSMGGRGIWLFCVNKKNGEHDWRLTNENIEMLGRVNAQIRQARARINS